MSGASCAVRRAARLTSSRVGTGAVGAFYGSRLHGPASVSVTCRSNYAVVSAHGLAMRTHSFGDYHFTPHAVFPSIAAAAESGTKFDYVVVATKALPDVTDDSQMIAPLVQPGTAVVLIQNGVGVEEPHRRRFPTAPILSAVTVVSAAQTEPGVVVQNRWTRINVGPFVRGAEEGKGGEEEDKLVEEGREATRRFVELLKLGGIADAEECDEKGLQLVRWHKLAVSRFVLCGARKNQRTEHFFVFKINASMNPSAVLSGGTGNARMSFDPELRRHLKARSFPRFPALCGQHNLV